MMILLLLGMFWLVPAVFSAANISQTDENVETVFVGRIIYTKWCGPGNDAANYDDLGENRDIDMCCRAHDHCDLFVEPGTTNYDFTNRGSYTISSCMCDSRLRHCLERLNFWVADMVMQLYAFTNNACLENWCERPYARCPREDIYHMFSLPFVFNGIQMSNDTNALNELIRVGMENEKKPTARESILNRRSHVQRNQNRPWRYYDHTQGNTRPVPHLFPPHAQFIQYPDPWQLQQIDYSPAPIQDHVQYHNLPNQQPV